MRVCHRPLLQRIPFIIDRQQCDNIQQVADLRYNIQKQIYTEVQTFSPHAVVFSYQLQNIFILFPCKETGWDLTQIVLAYIYQLPYPSVPVIGVQSLRDIVNCLIAMELPIPTDFFEKIISKEVHHE